VQAYKPQSHDAAENIASTYNIVKVLLYQKHT